MTDRSPSKLNDKEKLYASAYPGGYGGGPGPGVYGMPPLAPLDPVNYIDDGALAPAATFLDYRGEPQVLPLPASATNKGSPAREDRFRRYGTVSGAEHRPPKEEAGDGYFEQLADDFDE